ncbi:MAG: prephenate dehydrogenase [Methanobrevibacter sp.]|uniref:prephenate dehydrogenase n=1 Tax=uncultured Methanobrevibacter sp. TaxID=253161 RepID=UPI0025D54906|nr:prephenate dehydrogenase [uncultured Methanobrevibacter sp.]MEE1129506.1 prephenate dehydrogenase [Methanobrevibacter sp.]
MSDKSNMTIIGGTRGLGRWIAEHLNNEFNITITSRNKTSGLEVAKELNVEYSNDNIEAIQNADIVIFSVPIEHTSQTIKEVAPHAPEGSLLMDVCSIKTEAAEALMKYAPENVEILPCHPMFGPRVPTIKRQIVVLTPVENRSPNWFDRVQKFLIKSECEVVITTPEEHDKYMSIVQGLTHFSFITLASTIRKLHINVEKSRSFSSPVYSLMLDMVSRIVYQNPYLYYSIQKNNKETANARKALIKEGIYLSKLIEDGNEADFVKNIIESSEHLDDREEALIRSDRTIGMLTQKANVLTKSIGKEIGLKDLHSHKIYVGIVKKVTSKCVILENDDEISLKISSVDILSAKEVFEWKKSNLKLEKFKLSVQLPSSCDEKYLLKMFEHIEGVIDVEITDIEKISAAMSNFTFDYSTFNRDDKNYVEEYIKGIGGKINNAS